MKSINKKSESFVCEIPLRVSESQAKILNARFEVARQMYNALLGEGLRRLSLMRQSIAYNRARAIPPTDSLRQNERSNLFKQARDTYGFSEYALSRYATQVRDSWLGEHLDAHTVQKLTKRAFNAVSRVAYGKAKKVRFKGKRGLHSVEGKSQGSAIKWKEDQVAWSGINLPMVKDALKDPVIAYGLAYRVKYVRLVRRLINGKDRFYAQLVLEGKPYQKPEHILGTEIVGLDIGPSTIAYVGETQGALTMFCEPIVRNHREIRRQQRHIDRQRRANNPDCYDEKGRAIKGQHPSKKSRRMKASLGKLSEMFRKEAAYRKSLHGRLANQILSVGININTEKLSYRAFQKTFGKSVGVRAPGMFVDILQRKAESAGGEVNKFNTRTTALSQVCHCGERHKKPLKQRVHECTCGVMMQRDLYSAYLARFVKDDVLHATEASLAWSGAQSLLRAAWGDSQQLASGRAIPASFGVYRSQSESSEKEDLVERKGLDVVAFEREPIRAQSTIGS
ncbi:putative transposase DNA-binding domain protein [Peptococcaceae bacterium CEB3]|nr:putative transposase DNA-binding domain protein [Peptococcaceae bacterium CEB3]